MRIYIYGTGNGAIRFYDNLKKDKVELLGFLDSQKDKEGSNFLNNKVFHPEAIKSTDYDYIIIASQHDEIYDFLISLGFDYFKLVQLYNFSKMINRIDRSLNTINIIPDITDYYFHKHIITRKICYEQNKYLEDEFEDKYDFLRYKTLQLISETINNNGIEGSVAEVGVYQGAFAKIMNICFKERKLYLFDTFEGFDKEEHIYDVVNGLSDVRCLRHELFEDTNTDMVLSKMKYKDNCIIKKGYFPETTIDINEKFAFVSIDVDLFLPTYNALEFFYPRLNNGGYIFIHDYNTDPYLGVKQAVEMFENEHEKLRKVPIADFGGTLIIIK